MENFESNFSTYKNLQQKEGLSHEKNRTGAVLEKLSEKFPDKKTLLLTFLATIAAIPAPRTVMAHESTPETSVEQLLPEEALEQIQDGDFQEAFSYLCEKVDSFETTIPENVLYGESYNSKTVNDGFRYAENETLILPQSAKSVLIHNESVVGACAELGKQNAMQLTKHLFYVQESSHETFAAGEQFERVGFGATETEAIRNALTQASIFLGESVQSASEVADNTLQYDVTYVNSSHVLKEYQVTNVIEVAGNNQEDGTNEYQVTVSFVPGEFVEQPTQ